jgi:membrane protease YdiL (CAAX protease family)
MRIGRDLARVLLYWAAWLAIVLAGFLGLLAAVPALSPMVAAIWVTAMLCVVLAAGVGLARWWHAVGFVAPRGWRQPGWLVLPALLTLLPFAGGFKEVAPGVIGFLAVGYALTGFAEELMYRGVLLRLLHRRTPLVAGIISAVLFGLAHFANVFIRGEPAVIAAQALGAACFGFGYAALRYRTGTLLPLIVLHMATDLFLQLGALPLIPVAAVQDVILLGYGIYLFRGLGSPVPA